MKIKLNIRWIRANKLFQRLKSVPDLAWILGIAGILSVSSIIFSYHNHIIISYGDAESHLNIAKRVVHSLTPGIAQLGGIWLPLPHILMIPFVWFDPLWSTGLAGSIVSSMAFLVTCVYLFRLTRMLTNSRLAAYASFLIFATNPNVLYMQSTPMTELPLLAFFTLSSYYFIQFIRNKSDVNSLILAAFFGFCATLSRYDGWFLVLFEAFIIFVIHVRNRKNWKEMEGKLFLFASLAFFGVVLWMFWDYLILGDPFYFTNSQFSAKSQQNGWLAKNQLPAYKNAGLSFLYYFVTSMSNAGILMFFVELIGFVLYMRSSHKHKPFTLLLLFVPFIFNVFTLYVGQSLIFIPHLTPTTFEWTLFNVRYGLMILPTLAIFFGFIYMKANTIQKIIITALVCMQIGLYLIGYSKVMAYADGTSGLSQSKADYSEQWLREHYDGGYVLVDDYKRIISIIRTGIPMKNIIYIGSRPYWELSLSHPERYTTWIIMQNDDDLYQRFIVDKAMSARVYTYFQKTYTSPNILIFKRNVPLNTVQ